MSAPQNDEEYITEAVEYAVEQYVTFLHKFSVMMDSLGIKLPEELSDVQGIERALKDWREEAYQKGMKKGKTFEKIRNKIDNRYDT